MATDDKNDDGLLAGSLDDSVQYMHPYLDSASWLYLETDPIMRIANPHSHIIEYAMPQPKRKVQRHHRHPQNYHSSHCQQYRHHHHHHHEQHQHDMHQHRHRRNHRRVASDPGGLGNCNSQNFVKQHRRVLSLDDNDVIAGLCLVETAITEASEETPSPDEATRTLTFRKVPWHPNLHMLKTRQN